MEFKIVAGNVLTMLAFMLCGYLLTILKKGNVSHAKTLSAVLIYICCPAMILSSWQSMKYTPQNALQTGLFFVVSLVIQLLFFAVMYLILKNKINPKKQTNANGDANAQQTQSDDAKYRLLAMGSMIGNVGFFGLPLVSALFPNEPMVACFSCVYVVSMNLLVFTLGVFLLTGDKKHISLKSAILNPSTLAVLFALPFFFFKVTFPTAILTPIDLLGKMSTPLCMFILGMRLANANKKNLFTRPMVWLGCLLKLVVFPLFVYLLVTFLPFFDATFKASLLVLSATPSAVIILSLAEFHEREQELSANVILLSTLLSVITLPLIILLV
ncbi:MAG: AEC family transporter [Clostridia bacterium]|nr:AEC family transporter [Clostridia bacterium]